MDLWSLSGVLGRVPGQVSGGRYAAGHGSQQGGHLVEGHAGHDVVAAPAPAPPAEGHLAQPGRPHHAPGGQRPEHRQPHRPAGLRQEGPDLHEEHLPAVRPRVVQHPPSEGVAPLERQPRGGPGAHHDEPQDSEHHLGAGRHLADAREHPVRHKHGPVPGRRRPSVPERHRHFQPEPAGFPGEVGDGAELEKVQRSMNVFCFYVLFL